MEFIDFIHLDVTDENNNAEIISYVNDYLEALSTAKFDSERIHKLPAVIDKLSVLLNEYNIQDIDKLQEAADHVVETVLKGNQTTSEVKASMMAFIKLNSIVFKMYNALNNNFHENNLFSEFNSSLYYLGFSNKQKALALIQEAIELIQKDEVISSRQKKPNNKTIRKSVAKPDQK